MKKVILKIVNVVLFSLLLFNFLACDTKKDVLICEQESYIVQAGNQGPVETIGDIYLYLIEGDSMFYLSDFQFTGKAYKLLARLNGEVLTPGKDYTAKIIYNGKQVESIKNAGYYHIELTNQGKIYERNLTVFKGSWDLFSAGLVMESKVKNYSGIPLTLEVTGNIPENTNIDYEYFYTNGKEISCALHTGDYKVVAILTNPNLAGEYRIENMLKIVLDPDAINNANVLALISCIMSFLVIVLFGVFVFIMNQIIKKAKR